MFRIPVFLNGLGRGTLPSDFPLYFPLARREMLEGADHLEPQAKLAIVEDTITTGGSTLRAVEAVRDAGFDVAGVVTVVDRLEGGAD